MQDQYSRRNSEILLANIVEIIPMVVTSVTESDRSINCSELGKNTIRQITISRLTQLLRDRGVANANW